MQSTIFLRVFIFLGFILLFVGCAGDESKQTYTGNVNSSSSSISNENLLVANASFDFTLKSIYYNKKEIKTATRENKLYVGFLKVKDLNSAKSQTYDWQVYIDENNQIVSSSKTLLLDAGFYELSMLVENNQQQYIGYQVLEIKDKSQTKIDFSLQAVIGDIVTTVDLINSLPQFEIKFLNNEINFFDDPKIGVIVDNKSEQIYTINKNSGTAESMANLDLNNIVKINFYDGSIQKGKSNTFTLENSKIAEVVFTPFYGEADIVSSEVNNSLSMKFIIPNELVQAVGNVQNLRSILTYTNQNNYQEKEISFAHNSDGKYESIIEIKDLVFSNFAYSIIFLDLEKNTELARCSQESFELNKNSFFKECSIEIKQDIIITPTLIGTIGFNVEDSEGLAKDGIGIFANDLFLGFSGNGSFGAKGYLKSELKAGSYTLKVIDSNANVYLQTLDLLPLSINNIVFKLDNNSNKPTPEITYKIVDTKQNDCYDNNGAKISCNTNSYLGEDGFYSVNEPNYTDNKDDTITDNVTGLMWQKNYIQVSLSEAKILASSQNTAGYNDWRLPTIKELYSLIIFTGITPKSLDTSAGGVPYLDTDYFNFEYGDITTGARIIDAQYLSSTQYVSTTMNSDATVFGVNFADGRIKGYPISDPQTKADKKMYIRYVRSNTSYGQNNFIDNNNDTISDKATSLMWQKNDSNFAMSWINALSYCEDLSLAGFYDWRLPNAKELNSIVDYTRSPDTTNSASIDEIFNTSTITYTLTAGASLGGFKLTNYPYFWSSTSHLDGANPGDYAVYFSFGEAGGYMSNPSGGGYTLFDVHGAGAQRSDPKSGNISNFPYGHGPQGDIIMIENYVRCVRSEVQ